MSESVHLVSAGEVARGWSTSIAVCGEMITDSPDGGDDPRHCPDCVREALRCAPTVSDPQLEIPKRDLGECPYCAASGAARMPCSSSRVLAWSCRTCGRRWWLSNRYPQSLLDRIADELRIRTVLREVMALAEQASPLTDPQV